MTTAHITKEGLLQAMELFVTPWQLRTILARAAELESQPMPPQTGTVRQLDGSVATFGPNSTESQAQPAAEGDGSASEKIVTDSLGFQLVVEVHVVEQLQSRGKHTTYTNENGEYDGAPHTIKIRGGLNSEELSEVIAHEAYHLFYSVRNLVTADEEIEAEVFGHLVRRLHALAAPEAK